MPTTLGNSETFYDDVAAATTTTYVAKTGNDSSGDGSEGNPYLTINKAIDVIDAAGTTDAAADPEGARALIIVASGTYEEVIDCENQKNLTIRGWPLRADGSGRPCIEGGGSSNLQNNSHSVPGAAIGGNGEYGLIVENFHFGGWIKTGGYVYKTGTNTQTRFLNCEFSQSFGGLSNVLGANFKNEADWPSRIDCCTFRGGMWGDSGAGPDPNAFNGTAIASADGTEANGYIISNNVIYGFAQGIAVGSSTRATIINNTVLSCSLYGIYAVGPDTITNNIVARCGSDPSNGAGLVIDSDVNVAHTYNILTGNVRLGTGNNHYASTNLYDLVDVYGAAHIEAFHSTEQRVNPGLRVTGTAGNIELNQKNDWCLDVTPDFKIASEFSNAVDAGDTSVNTLLRTGDKRGYKREFLGPEDGRHTVDAKGAPVVITLKNIDVGAYEFIAWKKCQETTKPIISSDFTLNAGYSYQADDRYLADIDILPAGSAAACGADSTPPPFSAGIKGALSLRNKGIVYKLTPAGAGTKGSDKITKDDS